MSVCFVGTVCVGLIPGIDNVQETSLLELLADLGYEQFQKQTPSTDTGAAAIQEDDDDEVPELVPGETFEAAAEETPAQAS